MRGRATPRLTRLHSSHSYWAVLGAIGVGFLYMALAPDDPWSYSVLVLLQTGTLVLALWTAGWRLADTRVLLALATLGTALAALNFVSQGRVVTGVLGVLAGALTLAIAVVIAAGAIEQGEVNIRSVAGAICVYILIGMAFVFAYGVVAALGNGAFFAQGTDGTRALRFYFSFVTLATLGYGDYTPAGNLGHALAVLEALIGQLYLVTVVAVVVTRLSRPRDER